MNTFENYLRPSLQVCSLEEAREADVEAYGGVITIEDSEITNPFRILMPFPPQLILKFDDITRPASGLVVPEAAHVRSALDFAKDYAETSLLIHCHAGISRSAAIALAIFADWLGAGKEAEAVKELLKIRPLCDPNRRLVEIADRVLGRDGKLSSAVDEAL